MTPLERFMAKTVLATDGSGCRLWTGALSEKGYALFQAEGRRCVKAHRWLWLTLRGPVAAGLELDHLCRRRHCVNLDHLEPVIHRENILRGEGPAALNARKTTCRFGHPLEAVGNRRRCRTCTREAKRRYKQRQRLRPRAAA